MNNYIINPMWFYWLHIIDYLRGICTGIEVISLVITGTIGLVSVIDWESIDNEKKRMLIHVSKILFVVCCICCLILMFIPTKAVLIEMEIAKHATYENASAVLQHIKEATDYILDRMR